MGYGLFFLFVLYLHRSNTSADNAQFTGGLFGKINHTALCVGPAVVYAYFHRAAVGKVDHFYFGAEWKCTVCACHGILVKGFATGSTAAFKFVGIVRSFPAFSYFTGTGAKPKQTASQQE